MALEHGHSATVRTPQATYSGLEAGHHYEVTVQPLLPGKSGQISFRTS
jgi:hypothetical protein